MSKNSRRKRRIDPPVSKSLLIGERPRSDLTRSQNEAMSIFGEWFRSDIRYRKILRIGGSGGTGKSFLIRHLIDKYKLDMSTCMVISYTGQSANVLRKSGVMAKTIHASIMESRDEKVLDPSGHPIYKRGVPLMRLKFVPMKRLSRFLKLIIVDEASFLPKTMEQTLKSYGIPIFETGDPIQLPPVADEQVFNMDTLDYFMTDIVRQEKDSEIIRLATCLRDWKNIHVSDFHDQVRFLRAQETMEDTFYRFLPYIKAADMVITSTNQQRQIINDLYRSEVLHTNSPYPIAGERVICRQNNPSMMLDQYILANGTQGVCLNDVGRSDVDEKTDCFHMDFMPDEVAHLHMYYPDLACDSEFMRMPVTETAKKSTYFAHPGEKFQYAHAITAYSAQGAEADKVIFFDSYARDIDFSMRRRYVAATRAKKLFVYVAPYSKYNYPNEMTYIESIAERMAMM